MFDFVPRIVEGFNALLDFFQWILNLLGSLVSGVTSIFSVIHEAFGFVLTGLGGSTLSVSLYSSVLLFSFAYYILRFIVKIFK